MTRDVDWAFEQYETVRDVLPAAVRGAGRAVARLGEALEPYDTVMLDAFGVLNVGETAIPGAVEMVAGLREAGKRVVVVSNSASVPSAVSHAKFGRLGFDFAREEIITSRDALKVGLAAGGDIRWGVMATGASEIEELGVACLPLEEDQNAYDAADAFILLGSGEWTTGRQNMLVRAVAGRPRPVLVGNPDIVAPREDGLSLEPGYWAHDLARRTGCAPVFYGKPFGNIFDLVGAEPKRSVMVGDTLHTDVLGGAAFGAASVLLVDFGLFAGRNVAPYIARSGIAPDWVAAGY